MQSFLATTTATKELSSDAIIAEAAIARAAEQANATAITSEAATARAAEQANATAITSEATTARAAEQANATAISTGLNGKQDTIGSSLALNHTDGDGAFLQYASSVNAMMCGHTDFSSNASKTAVTQYDNGATTIGSGNASIEFKPNGNARMTLKTNGTVEIPNLCIGNNVGHWTYLYCKTGSNHTRFYIRDVNGNDNVNMFVANLQVASFSNTSDDRIKKDEEVIENATETLKKLKPQKYKKYSDEDNYLNESGLIAQEVYYNAPELRHLVHVPENEDGTMAEILEMNPTDDVANDPDYAAHGWPKEKAGLSYFQLIPYLIKSIQEQQAEIDALKGAL